MYKVNYYCLLLSLFLLHCTPTGEEQSSQGDVANLDLEVETPFVWENANMYFLLTDRFNNANPDNDLNFGRDEESALLRGFEGGDLAGIIQKIDDGYFDELGVNALWFTPVVEQTRGAVDEGTGLTYAYHGYWARDWTSLDPNFGTETELESLIETAHSHGIRVVLDVVLNHIGPVSEADPVWSEEWVRTGPPCAFESYKSTVECTLVENLPDIRTDVNQDVELPQFLKDKWKKEGRLEQEMAELDAFFERTRYPRAPRFYIIKWLCDYIRKYGVDGFRVDTAKHVEESVWAELYKEASLAFKDWKDRNPEKVLDRNEFYMVGEVYNYNISSGRSFDFGDRKVDFFNQGFKSLINFEFKVDAESSSYETIFAKYDQLLNNKLSGKSVLNYISSHDDGAPFDKSRERALEAGTKLLLCPGGVQIYYGDESARSLVIEGTEGDATLRSFMNWDEIEKKSERNGVKVNEVLAHWQKLGTFRKEHPAVGAGRHKQVSESPYIFSREWSKTGQEDLVLVGLDLASGKKTIDSKGFFTDDIELKDYYSGVKAVVKEGKIELDTPFSIVLLGLDSSNLEN